MIGSTIGFLAAKEPHHSAASSTPPLPSRKSPAHRAVEGIHHVTQDSPPLVIKSRLPSAKLEKVQFGQVPILRATSFNQRISPEVGDKVTSVAADSSQNGASDFACLKVDISLGSVPVQSRAEHLVSGMSVDAFFQTMEHIALPYLTRLMTEHFTRPLPDG